MADGEIEPGETQIFHEDRTKLARRIFVSLVFVSVGICFASLPEKLSTRRYSPEFIEIWGWITAAYFGFLLVNMLGSLTKPATVELNSTGLFVRSVWGSYGRPWRALQNFRLWRFGKARMVIFDDANPRAPRIGRINAALAGAMNALPLGLNEEPEQLLEAVREAQSKARAP